MEDYANEIRFHVRFLVLVLLAVLAACGSPRRSEPIGGPLPLATTQVRDGERVFMAHCYQCHPNGEAGLGPAINNKPLPAFLIRFQVRHGLGAMPAFDESLLPDDDLDALLQYLHALKLYKVGQATP